MSLSRIRLSIESRILEKGGGGLSIDIPIEQIIDEVTLVE